MKFKLLLTILALSVCVGGAYVGYDYLAERQSGLNLQILENGAEDPPAPSPAAENPPVENPPAATSSEENPTEENSSAETPSAENPPAENLSEEKTEEEKTEEKKPEEEKPEEKNEEKPQIQPSVPDFTVYDVEGNAVKLSDYFGKPIVLNFFASWCGPCRSEMPAFQAEYNANGDEIVFLFVSLDDTMQDAKDFIDRQGYTFPILHDTNGSAAIAYGVRRFPTTVFISREGHLAAKAVGALSASNLALGIEKIK